MVLYGQVPVVHHLSNCANSEMAVRIIACVLVLTVAGSVIASDSFDNMGVRIALRVYDECSNADGFSPCLKKKAITFLTRLARMDKFSLGEGIAVVRADDAPPVEENTITEDQLDKTLPRGVDAKDDALNTILMDKLTSFVSSRTLQVTLPKLDLGPEEGKKKTNRYQNKYSNHLINFRSW